MALICLTGTSHSYVSLLCLTLASHSHIPLLRLTLLPPSPNLCVTVLSLQLIHVQPGKPLDSALLASLSRIVSVAQRLLPVMGAQQLHDVVVGLAAIKCVLGAVGGIVRINCAGV